MWYVEVTHVVGVVFVMSIFMHACVVVEEAGGLSRVGACSLRMHLRGMAPPTHCHQDFVVRTLADGPAYVWVHLKCAVMCLGFGWQLAGRSAYTAG